MKPSFSKSVPFQKLRKHGRTQVESLLLIGLVGIGGVTGFDQFGDASKTLIAARTVASTASASPGVELGGTQQAAVGVFADIAELGRRVSKAAPESRGSDLYGNVPLVTSKAKAGSNGGATAQRAAEVFREGNASTTQKALEILTQTYGEPNSRLILGALKDVRQALGDETFGRGVDYFGRDFRNAPLETNAIYAAHFPATYDSARANLERARSVLPDDVYARLEALIDIFGDGIDEARRDALFGQPGQQGPVNVDARQAMAKVLPSFEEDVGKFELTRLEGNNVNALFASLQKTSLSPEAFAYLREALSARFEGAQTTSRGGNRRSVARRLVTEVLPAVIEGDAEGALIRLDAIDQSETLALAVAGREQKVAQLREAVRGAAARFRRGDDALGPVDESVVDGDLFARVRSEQLEGLPQAYATFLRGVVSALPTPAPSYVALDIEELVRLAAQRAALGRVDETRGFSTLILEASADADQARLVTGDLERFADRFARGRQQAGAPEARVVQGVVSGSAEDIPRQLSRIDGFPYFTALQDGLLSRIQSAEASFEDVVAELAQAAPGNDAAARLFARVVFDIKDDVGAEKFAAIDDFGRGYASVSSVTSALYAAEYALRRGFDGDPSRFEASLLRVADAVSDPVKEKIRALRDIFDQGIDEATRDRVFGQPVAASGSDEALFRDPVEVQPESTTAAQARRALGVADAGVP